LYESRPEAGFFFAVPARERSMDFLTIPFVKTVLVFILALVPILNPLGLAPIFLAMTGSASEEVRAAMARRIAVNAFIMLVLCMVIGSHVLEFFGLSLPVVRVGGGMLVVASAWKLLNTDDPRGTRMAADKVDWTSKQGAERAFFPLTFPLLVGPGSIAIAITLGTGLVEARSVSFAQVGAALVGVILVALLVFLSLRFAARLVSLLGDTGTLVFLRLSSFILLCIGVGIFWDGVSELLAPWRPGAAR
jgi:multiple antibiotic resistance protein